MNRFTKILLCLLALLMAGFAVTRCGQRTRPNGPDRLNAPHSAYSASAPPPPAVVPPRPQLSTKNNEPGTPQRVTLNDQPLANIPQLSVTRARSFTNSLGVKFVPVPGSNILMSIWETRVQDYASYAAANSGVDDAWKDAEFIGIKQGPDHPVVNVSWEDARLFCQWLSKKEGKIYRLPADHEWSLAAGIGNREDPRASPFSKDREIKDVFPWGTQWPPPRYAGNYGSIPSILDEHRFTSPVGSYAPGKLGIYDLGGNAYEWCEDEYSSSSRVLRGASWLNFKPDDLLSSRRSLNDPSGRDILNGFRVVVVVGAGGG